MIDPRKFWVEIYAKSRKWVDSNNFIPASLFKRIASMLSRVDGLAVALWSRLFAGRAHGEPRKIIVGAFGLFFESKKNIFLRDEVWKALNASRKYT